MKHVFSAHVATLAIVLMIGSAAQAGPIPPDNVAWTYNFEPGSPAVTADGNVAAGVTFTNESIKSAVGSSDIVASNLRVFSTATAAAPDMLVANGNYSLKLTLTTLGLDNNPVTAVMKFTGKLTGPFSAENANIGNVFGPDWKQHADLGGYRFDVELKAYTPPGPPDQTNAGSIAAHVTISNITPAELPEPSTMLMSGLGLSFLGGVAWRKRRQPRKANLA
jgi:hypothetical protein